MAWDRFQYLEKIGVGGMGEVWQAYDKETGAVVALKTLHSHLLRNKDLRRFRREMENLSRIRHKNVVRIVAISSDDTNPSYAMEFCPSGDLITWLEKRHTKSEKVACFTQLCEGIGSLHESEFRIIHRDLKPSNILLGVDSNFKISDLGLSVALSSDDTRVTTSNWGSPGYCPPEQYKDMKSVTESGDVYSLGAILRFMFTGKDCSESTDLSFDKLPKGVKQVLDIMLDPIPERRFRKASLISEFLKICMGNVDASIYDCKKCGGKGIAVAKAGDNYVGYLCPECSDSGTED